MRGALSNRRDDAVCPFGPDPKNAVFTAALRVHVDLVIECAANHYNTSSGAFEPDDLTLLVAPRFARDIRSRERGIQTTSFAREETT